MTSNDIKTIQLIVNSEQATKRLDDLKTKLTDIKRKKDEAFEKGDATAFDLYSKELRKTQKEISKVETHAATVATLKSSTHLSLRALPRQAARTPPVVRPQLVYQHTGPQGTPSHHHRRRLRGPFRQPQQPRKLVSHFLDK